jgi:hypothetical protein
MERNTKILIGVAAAGVVAYLVLKPKNTMVNFMGMNKNLEEFSKKRGEGAAKISQNAKDSGGLSLLTYYHFNVKEPYYKQAQNGSLDLLKSKKEVEDLINELSNGIKYMTIEQVPFQKLVGKIEVLGELLIENKENL